MKALDTNALVRFLVRDDEKQAQAVRRLILDAEKKGEPLFVPLAVTLETIWVLDSSYEFATADIIQAFEGLLMLSAIELEHRERISAMCRIVSSSGAGPADILIGLSSRDRGCESTLTFDRKAAKSDLFSLIR